MINKFKDVQFNNLILSLLFCFIDKLDHERVFGITICLTLLLLWYFTAFYFWDFHISQEIDYRAFTLFCRVYFVCCHNCCILMLNSRSIGVDYFIWIVVSQPDSDKFNFGFWIALY
jgi:hypothetical protein